MLLNVFEATDTVPCAGNTCSQCNRKQGDEKLNTQGQSNLVLDINSFRFEVLGGFNV